MINHTSKIINLRRYWPIAVITQHISTDTSDRLCESDNRLDAASVDTAVKLSYDTCMSNEGVLNDVLFECDDVAVSSCTFRTRDISVQQAIEQKSSIFVDMATQTAPT